MCALVMANIIKYIHEGTLLLTRREVAELFGVVPVTVKRWEQKGILTPIKVNERIVRYHSDEVKKLIGLVHETR
jgi:DNA-binding transcriptional MerR regulator